MNLRISAAAALALLLLLPAGARAAEVDARYEAALQKTFDLSYKREIVDQGVDEAVDGFLKGIEKEESLKSCPAADTAMRDFAQHQFRDAVAGYLGSQEFKDMIMEGMRKHYTQADLDAYIAFAESPAGASFLAHSTAAEAEVKSIVKARMEHLEDSPQISKMLSELGATLVVPMMKCQKK